MSTLGQQPIGVVNVAGKPYAAGLFWQAAATASSAEKEAPKLASEPGIEADFYCVRKGITVQFGLGKSEAGHKAGMPSAAACLADRSNGTWIGVFKTDSGWLYLSVRKGAIMPDGDALYPDEEAARDRLRMDLAVGGWESIYAPNTWGISQATEANLEELIAGAKSSRLKPVKASPKTYMIFGAGLVAFAAAMWYILLYEPPPPPVAKPKPVQKKVVELKPPPWEGTIPGADVLKTCSSSIKIIRDLPGFSLDAVNCNQNGLQSIHVRQNGFLSWLQNYDFGNATYAVLDPNTVSVNWAWGQVFSPRPEGQIGWANVAITEFLWSRAQDIGFKVELKEDSMIHVQDDGDTSDDPVYKFIGFKIEAKYSPLFIAEVLEDIPALIIDNMTLNAATGEWTIQGKAYVKHK
jgi:hypothetical protein